MVADTGDLGSFGAGLDDIDFWGASSTNPNDMRNNCVSVTLARLDHYKDVNELWQETHGYPLPDKPLRLPQILDLLRRTGWKYYWKKFVATGNQTAYQVFESRPWVGSKFDDPWFREEAALFCYIRSLKPGQSKRTGHCVVHWREDAYDQQTGVRPPHIPQHFLDFQHYDDGNAGQRLQLDIEAAEKIIILTAQAYEGSMQQYREFNARRAARREALVQAGIVPFDG